MTKKNEAILTTTLNIGKLLTMIIVVVVAVWNAYAKPMIREICAEETRHITEEVRRNAIKVKDIDFTSKQILLILTKTTDKDIIDEVRKETMAFKPEPDYYNGDNR